VKDEVEKETTKLNTKDTDKPDEKIDNKPLG